MKVLHLPLDLTEQLDEKSILNTNHKKQLKIVDFKERVSNSYDEMADKDLLYIYFIVEVKVYGHYVGILVDLAKKTIYAISPYTDKSYEEKALFIAKAIHACYRQCYFDDEWGDVH